MSEPVFFAVVQRHSVESPRLFYDRIPPDLTRKLPKGLDGEQLQQPELVYATRLDTMEQGDALIDQSLQRLFAVFVALRKAGKLPPEDRGIKPKPRSEPPIYVEPMPLQRE